MKYFLSEFCLKVEDCLNMEEEKLIKEVKKHKCLFDKSCFTYRNRRNRAEAWEAVAAALGYSVLVCQCRWRSLRDRYVKEYRDASVHKSSWKFYDSMDFIRPRKQTTSKTNSKNSFRSSEPELLNCRALIEEVKKHECIYEKRCLTYNNRKIRSEAWQSISETLDIPAQMCQSRWRSLRDRYVREALKTQDPSGSTDDVSESQWKYFELMDFLRQQVQPKKALTSVTDSKETFYSAEPEYLNCEAVQLIEEVRKHECIYNKKCLTYNSRKARAEAWQSITDALGIPVQLCQSRWKSLRDRYVRENIKNQQASIKNDVYEIHWKYYDIMDFLRHQIHPEKAFENLTFSTDSFYSAEPEELSCESLIESDGAAEVHESRWEHYEMMDFMQSKKAATSVHDSKDSISSPEPEDDSLQNTLDEILIPFSAISQSTESPTNEKRAKRRASSTLQSDDYSSSSSPLAVFPEKRFCPVQAPAEPDDHQGFFLMCRDLFKKLSSPKVDDAKVFFINHLYGQIKEMRDK